MILTLIPPLMNVKGGTKYVMDLPLHLIPVKGKVSFDAIKASQISPYSATPL